MFVSKLVYSRKRHLLNSAFFIRWAHRFCAQHVGYKMHPQKAWASPSAIMIYLDLYAKKKVKIGVPVSF
jgi:hypothetical protein